MSNRNCWSRLPHFFNESTLCAIFIDIINFGTWDLENHKNNTKFLCAFSNCRYSLITLNKLRVLIKVFNITKKSGVSRAIQNSFVIYIIIY